RPYERSVFYRVTHFLFIYPATTEIYTLSLHDALPIYPVFLLQSTFEQIAPNADAVAQSFYDRLFALNPELKRLFVHTDMVVMRRSEEHTSELQSRENLVCRLLLEKKKIKREFRYIECI